MSTTEIKMLSLIFEGVTALSSLILALIGISALLSYFHELKNRKSKQLSFHTRLMFSINSLGIYRNLLKQKSNDANNSVIKTLARPHTFLTILDDIKRDLNMLLQEAPIHGAPITVDIYIGIVFIDTAISTIKNLIENPENKDLQKELYQHLINGETAIRNSVKLVPQKNQIIDSIELSELIRESIKKVIKYRGLIEEDYKAQL